MSLVVRTAGKFKRFSFFKTPKVLLLAWDRVSKIKDAFTNKQYKPEDIQELICKLFNDVQNIHEELAEYINTPSWNRPAFYNHDDDGDEDYTVTITPVLSTEEPVDSLIMEDEHLDTISATESDEVIKSSVEDLVQIPNQFKDFSDSNDDSTSIDDAYFSIDDINYVKASPPDFELVSLEEVEDDILHENLLNIHLLIAKIKSLNDNPTPDHVLKSPSPFPIPGELTSVVMKDILGEPRVPVPNVLPTHPTIFWIQTSLFLIILYPNIEPDPGELTSIVDSEIRENVLSATNVNLSPEGDQSPLFAYVVWIFLPFLTYLVAPSYLLSFGNEDTSFDPGISIYHSFMPDFLNTSESSNDDSNVFNMPQEPIVFNQDPGENSSQSLSHIDQHCCYGCGDPLDGIFCRQCTCESCGNGAHISYNCPPKVLIISTPKPCHNQNVDEFPQTLTNFHPTCYSGDENSFAYDLTPNFVNDSPNVFIPPPQPMTYSYEFYGNDAHYSHDCPPQFPFIHQPPQETSVEILHDHENVINSVQTFLRKFNRFSFFKTPKVLLLAWDRVYEIKAAFGKKQYKSKDMQELFRKLFNDVQNIHEELAEYINTPNQIEEFFDSNDDSTSIDDDFFSIDNIDYVEASPPDFELVSLDGEIEDDILREKLLNINLLIAKIESLNDNPTPDRVLKSPSPFPIPVEDSDSFLEKSDTSLSYSDNSLPEFETLSDHTEETSSGSTTTHADSSLPKYDSFIFEIEPDQGELTSVVMEDNLGEPHVHILYFDIEEKNSGSTIIHADISLSDLDCVNFKNEPDPGELTCIVDSGIRENVLPATNVNLSPEDDQSPLFAYVVWIFLSFLMYPIVPPHLLSPGNKDTIFDPGISNYHFSSFMLGTSHQSGTFIKFNVYKNHLNESPMEILSST
nr:hypothetical protein [Tanacetum cinerariifolium]